MTVTWQGQRLGVALERLSVVASVPVWLDRRVDHSQEIDMEFADLPVREAISRLADRHGLGAVDLGNLIYVGPAATARGLAALLLDARAEAERVAPRYRGKWLKPRDVSWPRLSAPRTLLESTLAEAGIAVEGLQQVPHDLWPEREFPQLSLVDQTVLLLAGFDLTCKIAERGGSCRIVPIEHPLPDRTKELVRTQTQPARPPNQKPGTQQFSLKLTNQPVGRVIEQLGSQLKLKVEWDEPSLARLKLSKETRVSCDVKNVDLEGLFRAILKPAGMGFALREGTLKIHGVE